MEILTLIGGISDGSLNRKLFRAMYEYVPKHMHLTNFEIANMPFFSQDLEGDLPDLVADFKRRLVQSDAVLFITPEYNRSLPGVLKNAIDWGSRPYGDNSWEKKIVGIMGASQGNIGTFGAQQHLRLILSYLNTRAMEQPEFYLNGSKVFNAEGQLNDMSTIEYIQHFWKSFDEWIKKLKAAYI